MKALRSILSLLLAVLVLISSTSFTVSMHLCRGAVRDIAVLQDARPCAMELPAAEHTPAGSCTGHQQLDWKSCCEDAVVVFEANEYNYKYTEPVDVPAATFAAATGLFSIPAFYTSPSLYQSASAHYKPPSIEHNTPVFVQSFRL